jgi:hypothetical protein
MDQPDDDSLEDLTERELEVLRLVPRGKRNKEIARSSSSRKAQSKATSSIFYPSFTWLTVPRQPYMLSNDS